MVATYNHCVLSQFLSTLRQIISEVQLFKTNKTFYTIANMLIGKFFKCYLFKTYCSTMCLIPQKKLPIHIINTM